MKVLMTVYNNFRNDSRVLKEALSLKNNDYHVTIIAIKSEDTERKETIEGIHVHRFNVHSFKYYVNKLLLYFILPFLLPIFFILKTINYFNIFQKQKFDIKYILKIMLLKFIENSKNIFKNKDQNQNKFYDYIRLFSILDYNLKVFFYILFNKFDIVHAHDLNSLIGPFFSSKLKNIKIVYDSHELYLERNRYKKYTPSEKKWRITVEKLLINRVDKVITVNKSIAKYLANIYHIDEPLVIHNIPNNNSVSNRNLRAIINVKKDEQIMIYTGAITFNRGIEKILSVMQCLTGVHFVMMGYGNISYVTSIKKSIESLEINDRVHLIPPVPSNEVASYIATADCAIIPIENVCLSYYFCSPNKLFEAVTALTPIACSDFPEMRSIIEKYQIGVLFDPNSSESIIKAIREILQNNIYKQNILNSREEILSKFSWKKQEKKLLYNVYKQ